MVEGQRTHTTPGPPANRHTAAGQPRPNKHTNNETRRHPAESKSGNARHAQRTHYSRPRSPAGVDSAGEIQRVANLARHRLLHRNAQALVHK